MKLATCMMALAGLAVVCDARKLNTCKSELECLNELTYDECLAYRYFPYGQCASMWYNCKDHNYDVANPPDPNYYYDVFCRGGKSLIEYMYTCMKLPSTPRYSENDVQTCLKKTNADKNECTEKDPVWWTTKSCSCRGTWNRCHTTWNTDWSCSSNENGAFRKQMEECLKPPPPPPPRPPRPPTPDKETECLSSLAQKYYSKWCVRIHEKSKFMFVQCREIWPICDACDWSAQEEQMCDLQETYTADGVQIKISNNEFLKDMYECLGRQRCST
jgi:hypothetical protein